MKSFIDHINEMADVNPQYKDDKDLPTLQWGKLKYQDLIDDLNNEKARHLFRKYEVNGGEVYTEKSQYYEENLYLNYVKNETMLARITGAVATPKNFKQVYVVVDTKSFEHGQNHMKTLYDFILQTLNMKAIVSADYLSKYAIFFYKSLFRKGYALYLVTLSSRLGENSELKIKRKINKEEDIDLVYKKGEMRIAVIPKR